MLNRTYNAYLGCTPFYAYNREPATLKAGDCLGLSNLKLVEIEKIEQQRDDYNANNTGLIVSAVSTSTPSSAYNC
jgi:hypothetical protein